VQRQQLARLAEQALPVRRGPHRAAAAALQQGLPEQALQPLHLHGNGRLRAPHQPRGAGEAAFLGDQHEGAEQVWVEPGWDGHAHQNR
jgi:hypothetical protein